jgi:hypothetical protein
MITQISAKEVLTSSREQLGIPQSSTIDDTLLAALLRRAAGIHCPCSLATLKGAVLESLQHLADGKDDLEERLDTAAEGLIVIGDLLELHQVTVDDPNAKGTWVFSAPPGFIIRPSGSIFLVGIVPDETTPLPGSLNSRVEYDGAARVLVPAEGENLASVLRELGLREISTSGWLRAPKTESAVDLRDNMIGRLSEQAPSGTIADISILDSSRPVHYYSGRWIKPRHESGEFVARRPQAYGAPLWGFAHLKGGNVTKFLDFPLKGTRWRGCDTAWHLQMAIDTCRGTPQKYRRRPSSGGGYLDFFSPIPQWIHRRLCIVGHAVPGEHCLFSYWIPEREFASEEENIQRNLWLMATNS